MKTISLFLIGTLIVCSIIISSYTVEEKSTTVSINGKLITVDSKAVAFINKKIKEDATWCGCTDWLAWEPNDPNTGYYRLCGDRSGPSCMYQTDCMYCPIEGGPCCDAPW